MLKCANSDPEFLKTVIPGDEPETKVQSSTMGAKRECDEHVLHHFAIWQLQMHPMVLRGSRKSRMHMKVPCTTTLTFPTLSPLLTVGQNKV
jgi:hypothetical protein